MKAFLVPIAAVALVQLSSCAKDPCKDVDCNSGQCVNGTCECDNYHRGTSCEEYIAELIQGSWSGDEDCTQAGQATTAVIISHNSQGFGNNINIGPIRGLTMEANAIFSSIEIPWQVIPPSDFSGTGTISADLNTITLQVSINTGLDSETCAVVLTR